MRTLILLNSLLGCLSWCQSLQFQLCTSSLHTVVLQTAILLYLASIVWEIWEAHLLHATKFLWQWLVQRWLLLALQDQSWLQPKHKMVVRPSKLQLFQVMHWQATIAWLLPYKSLTDLIVKMNVEPFLIQLPFKMLLLLAMDSINARLCLILALALILTFSTHKLPIQRSVTKEQHL